MKETVIYLQNDVKKKRVEKDEKDFSEYIDWKEKIGHKCRSKRKFVTLNDKLEAIIGLNDKLSYEHEEQRKTT